MDDNCARPPLDLRGGAASHESHLGLNAPAPQAPLGVESGRSTELNPHADPASGGRAGVDPSSNARDRTTRDGWSLTRVPTRTTCHRPPRSVTTPDWFVQPPKTLRPAERSRRPCQCPGGLPVAHASGSSSPRPN